MLEGRLRWRQSSHLDRPAGKRNSSSQSSGRCSSTSSELKSTLRRGSHLKLTHRRGGFPSSFPSPVWFSPFCLGKCVGGYVHLEVKTPFTEVSYFEGKKIGEGLV